MDENVAVAVGLGLNSTGMLVGMYERGIKPRWLTFADTCGEKPWTYDHLEDLQKWLKKIGWPEISIVQAVKPAKTALTKLHLF